MSTSCDRSGSLAATFEDVRFELIRSISRLHAGQDFTILMMACDRSIDLDPNGLVPANMDNKVKAVEFMRDVTATGTTTLLASLKRAFEVLGAADKNKPGKVIYILSDDDFAGLSDGSSYTTRNGTKLWGSEAVIQWLRDHNVDKGIQVNPILLFNKDKYATEVYKQIAADNTGQFRSVSEDD